MQTNLGLPLMPSSTVSSAPRFLRALRCENFEGRPPVWIMRQAGRYLPAYQAIRKKHSLEEMFRSPELIYTITKQPIDILGVDAAILFADILHIPLTLGCEVTFPGKQGPVVSCPVELEVKNVEETLDFVREGIYLLKDELEVPLIGFCGGPFTVLKYMQGKRWIYSHPEETHALLQLVTDQSLAYLKLQEDAGVDAIQIFESWANTLSRKDFCTFALPYLKQLVDGVDIPVILFSRGSCHLVSDLVAMQPSGISFDWFSALYEMRQKVPQHIAIQGNLDPEILYASPSIIQKETEKLLKSMEGDPGFIVNLGHGILPDIPVDHVKCFVDTVKNYAPLISE